MTQDLNLRPNLTGTPLTQKTILPFCPLALARFRQAYSGLSTSRFSMQSVVFSSHFRLQALSNQSSQTPAFDMVLIWQVEESSRIGGTTTTALT